MKRNSRTFSSIVLSITLAVIPAADSFAGNQYQTYDSLDAVNGKVIFPNDTISTDLLVYIGPEGISAELYDGTWSNQNSNTAYKAIVNTEDYSLWMEPVGTVVTVVDGTSSCEDAESSTHFIPDYPDEMSSRKDIACYLANSYVTVKANEPAEGMIFDHWECNGDTSGLALDAAEMTFQIYDQAITLTAIYALLDAAPVQEEIPVEEPAAAEEDPEEEPVIEEPDQEAPEEEVIEEAPIEEEAEPVEEEPVIEEPVQEEPEEVIEEAPIEEEAEPVEEEPVIEEPVREEPEEVIEEAPIAEEAEPVEEEPVIEEPVQEEPIEESPVIDTTANEDTSVMETAAIEDTPEPETVSSADDPFAFSSQDVGFEITISDEYNQQNDTSFCETENHADEDHVMTEEQIQEDSLDEAFISSMTLASPESSQTESTQSDPSAESGQSASESATVTFTEAADLPSSESAAETHDTSAADDTAESASDDQDTAQISADDGEQDLIDDSDTAEVFVPSMNSSNTDENETEQSAAASADQQKENNSLYTLETDGSGDVSFAGNIIYSDNGSVEAQAGSSVKLIADEYADMDLDHWTLTRTDTGEILSVTVDPDNELEATFTMPSSNVYIEAIYREAAEEETQAMHNVVIVNGSGSGSYTEGKKVKIEAAAPPEGQRFKQWVVTNGNVTLKDALSSSTSFKLRDSDVEIRAEYELIPYQLSVISGSGTGTYHKGDSVSISAAWPAEGKEFASWTVTSGNTSVSAPDRYYANLMMPAADVTVEAAYRDGPSPAYNSIGGVESGAEYLKESTISFSVSGNGMNNTNPNPGDFRWRPSGYAIGSVSRDFTNSYSVSMAINAVGQYTLYVTFVKDLFDGNTWNATSVSDTKSVSFYVVNALSVQTGDNTPIMAFAVAAIAAAAVIILLIIILMRRRR